MNGTLVWRGFLLKFSFQQGPPPMLSHTLPKVEGGARQSKVCLVQLVGLVLEFQGILPESPLSVRSTFRWGHRGTGVSDCHIVALCLTRKNRDTFEYFSR